MKYYTNKRKAERTYLQPTTSRRNVFKKSFEQKIMPRGNLPLYKGIDSIGGGKYMCNNKYLYPILLNLIQI